MSIQSAIESKVEQQLSPIHLEVINESFMHNVPAGSESHFKVVVVSAKFVGKTLVERHRMVHKILIEVLKEGVHALSMQTFTPKEWEERGGKIAATPPCLSGDAKK